MSVEFLTKLAAFENCISKDLSHEMLVGLAQMKLNTSIPTIIKNLKYFSKNPKKVIHNDRLGICFNYSRYFAISIDYNDDFYNISNHCTMEITDSGYCIPDVVDTSCWEGMNKTYRIQYIHWIIRQLKLAYAL